jgi:hypothetical protein
MFVACVIPAMIKKTARALVNCKVQLLAKDLNGRRIEQAKGGVKNLETITNKTQLNTFHDIICFTLSHSYVSRFDVK